MRELFFIALLVELLFVMGAISPITWGVAGLTSKEAERAYELAWTISNELEEWSNWIVDGDERYRVSEDELGATFKRVEELISLLCREFSAHALRCRYLGY